MRNIAVNEDRARAASAGGYMNATELADYLVRKGVAFREAHEIVGKIVMRAIDLKVELQELSLDEFQKFSSLIEPDVYDALSLESTLNSKSQIGGTARQSVESALEEATKRHKLGPQKSTN